MPNLDKPKLPKGWKLEEDLYSDPEGKEYTQAQFEELVRIGVVDLPEDLIEPEFVSTDIGRIPRTGFVSELRSGVPLEEYTRTMEQLAQGWFRGPRPRLEPLVPVSEDINQMLAELGYEGEPIRSLTATRTRQPFSPFLSKVEAWEERTRTELAKGYEELRGMREIPELPVGIGAKFGVLEKEERISEQIVLDAQIRRMEEILRQPDIEPDVAEMLTATIGDVRAARVLERMYPYASFENIVDILMNYEDEFLGEIRRLGKTGDTVALLESLYGDIPDEQIDEFFSLALWGGIPEDIESWYHQRLSEIFPESGEITSIKDIPESKERTREQQEVLSQLTSEYLRMKAPAVQRQIGAGVGDIIASLGGLANWMGAEGIAKNLQDVAKRAQAIAPPMDPLEFTWDSIFTGKFWSGFSMQALRSLPFTLALLPTAFIGAAALIPVGAAVAARTTLGVFGQSVLRTVFGAAGAGTAARISESALEAGMTYDKAIQAGMSPEEASSVASRVFYQNLTLAGVDIAQFIAAFMPINPAGALTRLIGRGWVRVVVTGGKITGVALTEAGEEGVQELITRSALGEEIAWDDEMKTTMMIGGAMGAPLGGAGGILTKVTDTTIQSLPPEVKADISVAIENLKKQDVVGETAKIQALDEVGGKEIVQNAEIATEQAKIAEIEKIEPKTKADKIVLDQRIDKMKADVASLPGFERVLQAQLQVEKFAEIKARVERVQPIWTITKRVDGEATTWESGNATIRIGETKTGKPRYIASVEGVAKEYTATTLENAQKWIQKQSEYMSPIMPKGEGAPIEGRVNASGETVRMVGKYEVMLDEEGNIVICG